MECIKEKERKRTMIKCKDCQYWKRLNDDNDHRGTCHRYAPKNPRKVHELGYQWTRTKEDDECGDGLQSIPIDSKFDSKPKSVCTTDSSGTKYWYLNDELHRENGPAIEWANGSKEWWVNGKHHREDGPAIEWANGTKFWYSNGKRHREDGPAAEWSNGSKFWYLNGERHREDGPAIEWANGTKEWWVNGRFIREETK